MRAPKRTLKRRSSSSLQKRSPPCSPWNWVVATDGFLNEFFPECRTGGVFRNRSSSGEAFLYWVSLISAGVYGVFQFGFCDRYWFNVLALQCLLYFHPAAKWLNFRYLAAPSEEEGSCKERESGLQTRHVCPDGPSFHSGEGDRRAFGPALR